MKMALAYARSRQGSHTQWIHLSHQSLDSWETIPVFENLCFVIALFRSHEVANALEGRELLEKILAFQIPFGKHQGLFPRYLHKYPNIDRKEYLISIVLALAILQWQHRHILQLELQQALSYALNTFLEALQKQTWMDSLSLLLQALQGEEIKKQFFLNLRPTSVRECIHLLYLTQIVFLQKHPAATEMFHHLTSYWSKELQAYIGPLEKERYQSSEEPISLFHFFMGQITDSELKMSPALVHLHASLLYFNEDLPTPVQSLPKPHPHWKIEKGNTLFWQICTTIPEQSCPGFHLFRILWKDQIIHTALCQQLLRMNYEKVDAVESLLTFKEIPEYGVEIYFRKTKQTKIYSRGKRATCFSAGEWITLDTGNKKLCLQFSSVHAVPSVATLSMHHRPAELEPNPTNVDWRLSIRVLATDSKQRALQLRVREGMDCPLPVPLYADHCPQIESHL